VDKAQVLRSFTSYCKLLHDCSKYLQTPKTNVELHDPMKHLKIPVKWYWYGEILSVFVQVLWTLKFIFSRSHGKLFSVLFLAIILSLATKCKNDYEILKTILVSYFCPLKPELLVVLSDLVWTIVLQQVYTSHKWPKFLFFS